MYKTCNTCYQRKPSNEFYQGRKKCKTCHIKSVRTNLNLKTCEKIFDKFVNFDLETYYSNKLTDFRNKCRSEGKKYLDEFQKEPPDSELNKARHYLRDIWNYLTQQEYNSPFWALDIDNSYTIRAINHLKLMEPYDIAVYIKCDFTSTSGSYWMGNNRPVRYDIIEDKYVNELKRLDNRITYTPYIKRKDELYNLFGDNIPTGYFNYVQDNDYTH
jgi:hypothetical protein